MSHQDIIRAWKDREYRESLSEEEQSQIPENPAGLIELSDTEMETVAGGRMIFTITRDLSICKKTNQSPCKKLTKDHTCDPLVNLAR